MSYATLADLTAWTGSTAVSGDDRLLQRASGELDSYLIGVRYTVDGSGNPTDAAVVAALRDATCAQVEWWRATGDELNVDSQWQTVTLGPATMTRRSGATAGADPSTVRIAPRAIDILRVAGLVHRPTLL